ncbi:MAG: Uma2 family endonuclease [Cyanobacteria bacterium SBLK]|nr:Uma2 family endonuclease [Cyanobacteria bacterium SBLK]
MMQTIPQPQLITLDEFLDWYPDDRGRFELHNGVVVEMQPTGTHEQVSGFLALKFAVQIDRLEFPYLIPRQCIVKEIDSNLSGYVPDIVVLDLNQLGNEPLWKKRSLVNSLSKTQPAK